MKRVVAGKLTMPSCLAIKTPIPNPAHMSKKAIVCHDAWMYHFPIRGIKLEPRGYRMTKTMDMMTPWAVGRVWLGVEPPETPETALPLPLSSPSPSPSSPELEDPGLLPLLLPLPLPLPLLLALDPVKGFESELMLALPRLTWNSVMLSCWVMMAAGFAESRESPDFHAEIQFDWPEKSRFVQLPHRTLATMLPPTTPEPARSSTSLLALKVGMTWFAPGLVLSVTFPLPSWYMMNMLESGMEVPMPRPIHCHDVGALSWKKMSPESAFAVASGTPHSKQTPLVGQKEEVAAEAVPMSSS